MSVCQLKELENGIKDAQESYRKLELQVRFQTLSGTWCLQVRFKLKDNQEKMQSLHSNNKALRSERNLLEYDRKVSEEALKAAKAKCQELVAENDTLRNQASTFAKSRHMSLLTLSADKGPHVQTNGVPFRGELP